MATPSISIAIPSYNRRSSLASLLAATVEQLEDDDELIVVDDGSSDDSAHEVLKFARCRLIRHEVNQGMVRAWSACLKNASRDWICLIHNDDRVAPCALDAIRAAARLAAEAVMQHTGVTDERRDAWQDSRWTGYLSYMFKTASRLGDRRLLRKMPRNSSSDRMSAAGSGRGL